MNIQTAMITGQPVGHLVGRVSIVTGSTSGIGLGIARALAAAGSDVILNGFGRPDEIARAQQDIATGFGVSVLYSPADMTKPETISAMIQMALDPFHTTRLALAAMRKNKWGRIVNIASAHGLVGSPFKSAYVAAKHGILGLTKVVALETAEEGITCNAVCPGYVYTPLVEAQIEGQAKAHGIARDEVIRDVLLAQQPNKKFATVEELGALVAFLASDAAASITGAALPIDGGWTAH